MDSPCSVAQGFRARVSRITLIILSNVLDFRVGTTHLSSPVLLDHVGIENFDVRTPQ